MQQPLEIRFRDMKPSTPVEEIIRRKAAKLEQVYDRIVSCRVTVESPHRRHTTGNQFHIRIDLGVPGDQLVVTRNVDDEAHQDVYVAIRDAFRAARRELRKLSGKRRAREVAVVAPAPMV
jgi:ribosome-associated translation inhibitor RaiA